MEWGAMLFLGAYHGVNPAMGWLFAVALGMQQGSARGVWRALPPLAMGHAIAVAVVLLGAGLARMVVPLGPLKAVLAAILVTFGIYRLLRHRHPRFGGMQVGFRDLSIWSFLMASAHGAGLMLVPFVMGMSQDVSATGEHLDHMGGSGAIMTSSVAVAFGLHTFSYFAVMTFVAWIVYTRFGVALLRTSWFNLDWLWAAALVAAGAFIFFR